MLEMAETASSVLLEVSSEEGSLRGSREKLIATPKVCNHNKIHSGSGPSLLHVIINYYCLLRVVLYYIIFCC